MHSSAFGAAARTAARTFCSAARFAALVVARYSSIVRGLFAIGRPPSATLAIIAEQGADVAFPHPAPAAHVYSGRGGGGDARPQAPHGRPAPCADARPHPAADRRARPEGGGGPTRGNAGAARRLRHNRPVSEQAEVPEWAASH